MELTFTVTNQRINYTGKLYIVENSRNYLTAKFRFSGSEWKGIIKTAVFRKGDIVRNVILDEEERCSVPSEVITMGTLQVSVFGGDLVTVGTANVKILKSGYSVGDAPGEPSEDVYAQILEELQLIRTEPVQRKLVAEAVDAYLDEYHVEALSREDVYQIVVDYVESHKEELRGEEGKSTYDIAVEHGFVGTEEEWLKSLYEKFANRSIYGDTSISNGRLSDSTSGANSIAYGKDCVSSGDYSQSFGLGTVASHDLQHVHGTYNDNHEDSLYEIGNGTDDGNRSNALRVTRDGTIEAQTDYKLQDGTSLKQLNSDIQATNEAIARETERAKEEEKKNSDAIVVLNGDTSVNGSVSKTVADAIGLLTDGAPESMNTFKKTSENILGLVDVATEMQKYIIDNKKAIEDEIIRAEGIEANIYEEIENCNNEITKSNAAIELNAQEITKETNRATLAEKEISDALSKYIDDLGFYLDEEGYVCQY